MDLPLEFLETLDVITLLAIAGMFWVFNSRLDKKFNDQSKRIDELSLKIESFNAKLDAKIDKNEAKFDSKLDLIEKDIIQMNTRMAVIESRLSDINTNLTHLMWHSQAIPPKEEVKS